MTTLPTKFGPYGGQFVPETLMPALEQLEAEFQRAQADRAFQSKLNGLLVDYAGRPTPLTLASRPPAPPARLGLERAGYMGGGARAPHQRNVFRMRLRAAEVRRVASGSRTLK